MSRMGARAKALDGPWECHEYAHMIANVEYHDGDGTDVNICAYWDDRFGELLAQAWAVPPLRDVLQRIVRTSEQAPPGEDVDGETAWWLETLGELTREAQALLARLEGARP